MDARLLPALLAETCNELAAEKRMAQELKDHRPSCAKEQRSATCDELWKGASWNWCEVNWCEVVSNGQGGDTTADNL